VTLDAHRDRLHLRRAQAIVQACKDRLHARHDSQYHRRG